MLIALPMNSGKANYHINQAYVDYLQDSGYTPLGVFNDQVNMEEVVEMAGGLLLPGGIDIDPVYYGEDNLNSYNIDPEKDMLERNLLYAFAEAGKPIFGICRGFQLIVREIMMDGEFNPDLNPFGYVQHINGHATNERVGAARNLRTHNVATNKHALYGEGNKGRFTKMFVNSMHHQGLVVSEKTVLSVGKENNKNVTHIHDQHGPITILAFTGFGINNVGTKNAQREVVIEGMDVPLLNSIVRGVQWHPEELGDVALLQNYFNYYEQLMDEQAQ